MKAELRPDTLPSPLPALYFVGLSRQSYATGTFHKSSHSHFECFSLLSPGLYCNGNKQRGRTYLSKCRVAFERRGGLTESVRGCGFAPGVGGR